MGMQQVKAVVGTIFHDSSRSYLASHYKASVSMNIEKERLYP